MDPITTNTLNKNNVYTTRYFNNGTIYADFIKTSDGQLVNVKDTASEIELEDIRDDIRDANTYLSELNTKYNNLQGDVDLMSIDIQSDLFSPLYTNENDITRMTGLTNYINSKENVLLKNFSSNAFFGVINLNTNIMTTLDFKILNMPMHDFNTISSLTNFSNLTIGKIFIKSPTERKFDSPEINVGFVNQLYFDIQLDFTSFNSITYNGLISIHVPDKILNIFDNKIYSCGKIDYRSSAIKLNNLNCCSNFYLYFRNHTEFYFDVIRKLFDTSSSGFGASRLTLIFLKQLSFNVDAVERPASSTTQRVKRIYHVAQRTSFYGFLGIYFTFSFPIPNKTIDGNYGFTSPQSGTYINTLTLPSQMMISHTVTGNPGSFTTEGTYYTLSESDQKNHFELFLLRLANDN